MRFRVTVYYCEPLYAQSRGIPVHEQRGTFEVAAHAADEALRLGVGEFKEAARKSSVAWPREITRVTATSPDGTVTTAAGAAIAMLDSGS